MLQMARYYQPFRISSLILLLRVLLVTATCYGSDSNHTAQLTGYTPCNQNTPFSMCIRNQASYDIVADIRCLPNGVTLCSDFSWPFWREGCTDPSWKSDYCLKAFNACPLDTNNNVQVTPCSGSGNSTTWCCGARNTACCGQAGAITIAATLGPSAVWSTIYLSSTVSPTSTSKRTALSVGVEAGIGVSVSLAGLAILGGIIWFVLRMRRREREHVGGSRGDGNTRHGLDGEPGFALPSKLPTGAAYSTSA